MSIEVSRAEFLSWVTGPDRAGSGRQKPKPETETTGLICSLAHRGKVSGFWYGGLGLTEAGDPRGCSSGRYGMPIARIAAMSVLTGFASS